MLPEAFISLYKARELCFYYAQLFCEYLKWILEFMYHSWTESIKEDICENIHPTIFYFKEMYVHSKYFNTV